jgi:hypothetical protein
MGTRLAEEVMALRQCIGWLEQAERGARVVVNLRPDTDAEPEFVGLDQLRIRHILERIAADLDDLARVSSGGCSQCGRE